MASPQRIAFIGQATFFRACAMHESSDAYETRFFEFRAGRDAGALRRLVDGFAPDAIVVFRPEALPAGTLSGFGVPRIGMLSEPITRKGGPAHWDLESRRADLLALDPDNVDRLVAFDPMIIPTAEEVMPVWRAFPLPVADALYGPAEVEPVGARAPRFLFVGRSTLHREQWLMAVKHRYETVHVAFGAQLEDLVRLFPRFDATINVHNEPYPSFENRILLHLAAGHLVITEPVDPTHGLRIGTDLLEAGSSDELLELVAEVDADPDAFLEIRRNGRARAEEWRASTVWPQTIADAAAELRGAVA